MAHFILAHDADYRAATLILLRQAFEMTVEVGTDLLFGFLDKAKAPLVARGAGKRSNRE